jgi:PAS domain S-box-containing protein
MSPKNLDKMLDSALMEIIPFNVAIIDRQLSVIRANSRFEKAFGEWRGKKCYEAYKNLNSACQNCRAMKTFTDGKERVMDEVGRDLNGRRAHYLCHLAPIRNESGEVVYIAGLSHDITESKDREREFNIFFERVPCYITVIDRDYKIIRANERFRDTFGDTIGDYCYKIYKRRSSRCTHCPAAKTFNDGGTHTSEQLGITKAGQNADYVVTTTPLTRGEEQIEHVIEISTDITEMKMLEKEVLEAERLAAVGQTVAGLAHSIKNILMGLEGGKYIVSVGLKKDDKEMIAQGWEMLERNFEKTTSLVKDFLSFAKGRLPEVQSIDPNDLVMEIIELYKEIAKKSGIDLRAELDNTIKKTPLDPKGIHTCLTNLVSNALDACEMSDKNDRFVCIKTKEEKGMLIFEVTDNGCGMDCDIKRKIFTTFFTTKGGGGTGLGLLTTRKIIQEHGGKIIVHSKKGEGAHFRIELPRRRLKSLLHKEEEQ